MSTQAEPRTHGNAPSFTITVDGRHRESLEGKNDDPIIVLERMDRPSHDGGANVPSRRRWRDLHHG